MTDFRVTAFRVLSDGFFGWLRGVVTPDLFAARRKDGAAPTTSLSPQGQGAGCPICELHRQAGEGYLLLRSLAEVVQIEGEIPAGVGGTIPLARESFESADRLLTSIAAADPKLAPAAVQAQGHVVTVVDSLSGTVSAARLHEAAQAAEAAYRDCYQVALAAFRQDPTVADPVYGIFERVAAGDLRPDAAYEELRRVAQEEPSGAGATH